jgi:hypothetical protein
MATRSGKIFDVAGAGTVMRAAVGRRDGPPGVVRVEERPVPRPLEQIAGAHARVDAGHIVVTMP